MAKRRLLTDKQLETVEEWLPRLLETPIHLSIKEDVPYARLHDDHDGDFKGTLGVCMLPDQDMVVTTSGRYEEVLRFRTSLGGGMSPRVWNALRILALAIKLDNQERPQRRSGNVPAVE